MASNPLTYSELEAYERKSKVCFRAWEVDLIMDLDDVVLAGWAEQSAPATAPPGKKPAPHEAGPIPASNTGAVKAMLQSLAARKRHEAAQQ